LNVIKVNLHIDKINISAIMILKKLNIIPGIVILLIY
jgi:hypothetical protein